MNREGVPSSYSEMVDEYQGYVRGLVWKLGIRENEDVAQEILLRFYARGFLEKYDPTVNGHGKQTSFKAFLRAFVERYSRHYRERQGVRDRREPVICDRPVGGLVGGQENATLLVELMQVPHTEDPAACPVYDDLRLLCRARLAEIPNRGQRDLVRLFDIVERRAMCGQLVSRKEIAVEYGASPSVVSSMITEMKEALSFLQPAS